MLFRSSAKVYDIEMPYPQEALAAACRDVIKTNKLPKAYIRPIAFRGVATQGAALSAVTPTEVAVAAWEMGAYLGAGVLEQGIDAGVSTWQRFYPISRTVPPENVVWLSEHIGEDRFLTPPLDSNG